MRGYASDSMCYTFDGGNLCLTMEENNNRYELSRSYSGSPVLKCDIITPNRNLYSLFDCDGSIAYYGDTDNERMEIQISYNTDFVIIGYDIEQDNLFIIDDDNDISAGTTYFDLDGDTTIDEDDQTTINIRVRKWNTMLESYNEDVEASVLYRSSSRNSWQTVTNNSSYVSLSWRDFEFDRNDDGRASIRITPRREWQYRLIIEEERDDDVIWSIILYVDEDNNNNNNDDMYFDLYGDTTIDEDDQTTISIRVKEGNSTFESYDEDVEAIVQYRSSSRNSRQTVTTNSSYVSLSWRDFEFDRNDDGRASIRITPRREWQFRLTIEEERDDDVTGSIILYVGDNNNDDNDNNTSSWDDFSIRTDTTIPSDKPTGVIITALESDGDRDDNYDEDIRFLMQYRSSSTHSRQDITTNTSYVRRNVSRIQSFERNDDGEKDISNLFTPQREGEYRLIVEEEDNDNIFESIVIDVDDRYTNSNIAGTNYILEADTTVRPDEYVDLDITVRDGDERDQNYEERIRINVEYRSSSGRSWSSVTNSISYIDLDTSSYQFDRFDRGEIELNNFAEFKREGEYRVTVYQSDNRDITKSITFLVDDRYDNDDDESDISWFSRSEINDIEDMYDARPQILSVLEDRYRRIRSSSSRERQSDEMYSNMYDLLYRSHGTRERDDYNDFRRDLINRANLTNNLMR